MAGPSAAQADFQSRAVGAQRIVVATVMDVVPRFATNAFGDQLIVSRVWLRVQDTWKGPAAPIIFMDLEGGTVGDLTLRVSDLPALHAGVRGVFFLIGDDNGAARLSDRSRSFLPVDSANRLIGSSTSLTDVQAIVSGTVRGGGH
jgi:hypothetical protein